MTYNKIIRRNVIMSIKKTIKKVVEDNKEEFVFLGIITTAALGAQVVGYTLVKIIDKVVR
jgi:hypothetical protein